MWPEALIGFVSYTLGLAFAGIPTESELECFQAILDVIKVYKK